MNTAVQDSGVASKPWSLRENAVFKDLFVTPWTYVTGAVILALLNIVMTLSTGSAWGVTTAFSYWAGWLWNAVGGDAHTWAYFGEVAKSFNDPKIDFLTDKGSILDLGVLVGALLATLLASQARFKNVKSGKQVVAACLGGLLMGFGARMSFGCNIGAMFTGLPSMSLHGWVFMVAIFIGAWIGSRLLVKYFI